MSRSNAAKKARRKKRLVARNDGWLPDDVHADVRGVALIDAKIVPRGWAFDHDFSTDEFVTWYYAPSGVEASDELDDAVEPVTRIWLTDSQRPHVILVGSDGDAGDIALSVEELFGRLEDIETYRLGEPMPEFG